MQAWMRRVRCGGGCFERERCVVGGARWGVEFERGRRPPAGRSSVRGWRVGATRIEAAVRHSLCHLGSRLPHFATRVSARAPKIARFACAVANGMDLAPARPHAKHHAHGGRDTLRGLSHRLWQLRTELRPS